MGNPRVADLNLKRRPIIWDAHYFHTETRRPHRSHTPQAHPERLLRHQGVRRREADILQFSDRVRFSEFTGDANIANTDREGCANGRRAA